MKFDNFILVFDSLAMTEPVLKVCLSSSDSLRESLQIVRNLMPTMFVACQTMEGQLYV